MQFRKFHPVAWSLFLFAAAGSAHAASLSGVDRNFMVTAAKIDMTEANEGQLAQNVATRADVKDFAKSLVQDHTESYGHLSELASKRGVSIPRGIDSAKVPAIQQLSHLKGDRFDRRFAQEEVAANRQALAVFKREAARGKDSDVKDYATRTIPVLEKNLRLAEDCAKTTGRT
jgi:putative membrane protein